MPAVQVTPMIGMLRNERLHSLAGCHAIFERSVTKPCTSDSVGQAVTEAIRDIILAEADGRRVFKADEIQVIVKFLI